MTNLEPDELKRLLDLFEWANKAPVIKFSSDPKEEDVATRAWRNVAEYMDELGKKYNVDLAGQKYGVDPKTGEIKKVE
jgi:hypothetical protein